MKLYKECLSKALYLLEKKFIREDQIDDTVERLMGLEERKHENQNEQERLMDESR